MEASDGWDGLGSFIRLTGINVSTRAQFIGETIMTATVSSLTLGLVCGSIGSSIPALGPLAPFLWGSGLGYSAALLSQWKSAISLAKRYARNYPSLMSYAIQHADWNPRNLTASTNIPSNDKCLEEWISKGGISRTTTCIMAALSIKSTVREIEERGRGKIAQNYYGDE
jgi:hypothetical protein